MALRDVHWNVIAAIVVLIAALVGLVGRTPIWFLATAIGVVILAIATPFAWNRGKTWLATRSRWQNVKRINDELLQFVDRFSHWGEEPARADNMHYQLRSIYGNEEALKGKYPDAFTLKQFVLAANPILRRQPQSLQDFQNKIRLFEAVLNLYKEEYVAKPLRILKPLPLRPGLSPYVEEIKKYRPAFDAFFNEYTQFAERVNQTLGDRICLMDSYLPPDVL